MSQRVLRDLLAEVDLIRNLFGRSLDHRDAHRGLGQRGQRDVTRLDDCVRRQETRTQDVDA